MSTYEVIIAPRAAADLAAVNAWWRENRPAAPALFIDEFTAVLAEGNLRGMLVRRIDPPVRRVLLVRTRYHVYYDFEHEMRRVQVLAIRHAARGRGPRL